MIFERSFGYASYELRVPFTPATPTNVASITKPLTIIILERLVEQGKLRLQDTVSRWLPEYVYGNRMTVDQLVNHRAGVPHRLLADDAQESPRTASDMVQAANKMPLLFEPGSRSEYSSGGYSILAAVLERASGKSYDALLQEYVAKPVGARTIRHLNHQEILPGRAESVIPAGDLILNAPLRDLSFLVGGGSVYTTPRDIFSVMWGLVRGTYGAGAREALLHDNGFRWNGITNGFRAFADWNAADSVAVLFFGNAHTGAIDLMRREVPRIAAGATVAPAEVPKVSGVALSDSAQARLTGTYNTGGGSVNFFKFVSPRVGLFGDRAMLALDDTTFFSYSDYARVWFRTGSAGTVEAIQWGPGTWGTGEMGPRFARAGN